MIEEGLQFNIYIKLWAEMNTTGNNIISLYQEILGLENRNE